MRIFDNRKNKRCLGCGEHHEWRGTSVLWDKVQERADVRRWFKGDDIRGVGLVVSDSPNFRTLTFSFERHPIHLKFCPYQIQYLSSETPPHPIFIKLSLPSKPTSSYLRSYPTGAGVANKRLKVWTSSVDVNKVLNGKANYSLPGFLSPAWPVNELDQGMALVLGYLQDSQLKFIGFLKVWIVDSSGYLGILWVHYKRPRCFPEHLAINSGSFDFPFLLMQSY